MLARFEWRLRKPSKLRSTGNALQLKRLIPIAGLGSFVIWLFYRHLLRADWFSQLPPFLNELLNLLEAAAITTALLFAIILLWRKERERRAAAKSVSLDSLYSLSPADFERFVAGLFRKKGYAVTVRGRSGDHGVDLELLSENGRRAVVQCKRYRNPIGPDIVRELFGTMIHERVHHSFLVTTADISPAAREWAENKPITLIDGSTLVQIAASLKNA